MTVYQGNDQRFKAFCDKQTFEKIVDYKSVQELFRHSITEYADKIAISDEEEVTYSRLADDVACYRGVLKNANVGKGDFVGILLPNSYDAVKAFFAVATSGAVAVLFPVQLPPQAIFGCSMKYNLKAIVTNAELMPNTEMAKGTKKDLSVLDIKQTAEKCEMTDAEIKRWYETKIAGLFDPRYGTPEIEVQLERIEK